MTRAEEEVGVDLPAVRLRRCKSRDPFRWLLGESVEDGGGAEERQADGVGLGRCRASNDAVILPRQGSNAETAELIYCRSSPPRVAGAVPDHQLEWSSEDPAGVVDLASGELESGKQV